MSCELPILLRFCFCFPLRYGLLVWAYMKQILSALVVLFFMVHLCHLDHDILSGYNLITSLFLIIILTSDIAFTIVFIIGVHTKHYKTMRIFYKYSVTIMWLYATQFGLISVHTVLYVHMTKSIVEVLWNITGPILIVSFLLMIIQGYMIILIRSEILKLKNNSQFKFINQAAGERCAANIDSEKEMSSV